MNKLMVLTVVERNVGTLQRLMVEQRLSLVVPTATTPAPVSGTTVAPPGRLPRTGAPFLPELLWIALVLIVLGRLLGRAARRTRRGLSRRPVAA